MGVDRMADEMQVRKFRHLKIAVNFLQHEQNMFDPRYKFKDNSRTKISELEEQYFQIKIYPHRLGLADTATMGATAFPRGLTMWHLEDTESKDSI